MKGAIKTRRNETSNLNRTCKTCKIFFRAYFNKSFRGLDL